MFRKVALAAAFGSAICMSWPGFAAAADDIQMIREEIQELRRGYEARIHDLEQRLAIAEQQQVAAKALSPAPASEPAPRPLAAAASNAFNPAMSLIVGGQFSDLQRDPESYQIGGFIPGGDEIGPGARSFSLGESELTISANIDPYLSGYFVMSVSSSNSVAVEEGYVQSAGFIPGVNLKFGRMLSAFGYLNETHAHSWDFVDAPLVQQAFFGGKLQEDGLQARWLAPTPMFFELGAEAGRGGAFPGSDRNRNGVNSTLLFAHLGDDLGVSSSYRVGASWRKTRAQDRPNDDFDSRGGSVIDTFSGDSSIWGLDLVWKWAPNGNVVGRNFKLQAEYMHRTEDGSLAFDVTGLNRSGTYRSSQSGWYVQGTYQFMPRWRVGLRHDALESGTARIGLVRPGFLSVADFPRLAHNEPKRSTAMIDFSPSEFSRFRLQLARDEARFGEPDDQFTLQYLMSLGAHGAHKF